MLPFGCCQMSALGRRARCNHSSLCLQEYRGICIHCSKGAHIITWEIEVPRLNHLRSTSRVRAGIPTLACSPVSCLITLTRGVLALYTKLPKSDQVGMQAISNVYQFTPQQSCQSKLIITIICTHASHSELANLVASSLTILQV